MHIFRGLVLIATIVMVFSVAGTCQAFAVQKLQTGDESIVLEEIDKEEAGSNAGSTSSAGSDMKTVPSLDKQEICLKNAPKGVKITWNRVKGASSYAVYKKKNSKWVKLDTLRENAYVDKRAAEGKKNTYAVRTKLGGKYSKSKEASIVYLKTPQVELTALKNGVKISWNRVSAAERYTIYRLAPGESKFRKIAETTDLAYKNTAFGKANGSYRYFVRAVKGDYVSSYRTQRIEYKHIHSYKKKVIRTAKRFVYGIRECTCKGCGYSKIETITPKVFGVFLKKTYSDDLKAALKYQKKTPGYKSKPDRKCLRQVAKIEKPRYMLDVDDIYRAPTEKGDGLATIMVAGDLMCMKNQIKAAKSSYHKYWFEDSFDYVRDILKSADFAVGNLECVTRDNVSYSNETPHADKIIHCNAPSTYIGAVRNAGFDMVTMANNHNCDAGVEGVFDTLSHVDQYGLVHTGLFRNKSEKRYQIVEIDGINVAFLAYATYFNYKDYYWTEEGRKTLLNRYSASRVKRDIANAKAEGAEYVIVSMHAGREFSYELIDKQINAIQTTADAGADYIIGSHPHILQKYETINTSDGRQVPVIYSMGNFLSQMNDIDSKASSVILQIQLKKNRDGRVNRVSEGYIPIYTYERYNHKNYAVVPLTKPYNTCGFSNKSKARNYYKKIVKAVGPGIDLLGKFK